MAKNARTPSDRSGVGGNLVAAAAAAAPVILGLLKALDTPENRDQLKEWTATADRSIRRLTIEGRVDARIAVLRAQLERSRPSGPGTDRTGAWATRLAEIENKRALLRGPFDAKARRKHLKALSGQLDALWTEIFEQS